MKIFVAIQFPADIKSALLDVQSALKDCGVRGNWCSDNNLHMTMVYIGETDEVELIQKAVDEVSFEPFVMDLGKLGTFVTKYGRVIWCGVRDERPLNRIAKVLRERLDAHGIRYKGTKFKPHISLLKEANMDETAIDIENASMTVDKMVVMKSEKINGEFVYSKI
ncbi:MAG: RNA 2',3'-cyclic phosphodiesterase [Bacteroidales bacterium]|nr:RNA 2',3'-cyclic phosphodiesterase [Bacteroidales bacterium]